MTPPTAFLADVATPNTKAGASTPSTRPDALAWQREMERAQSEQWFKPWHPPRHRGADDAVAADPVDRMRAGSDLSHHGNSDFRSPQLALRRDDDVSFVAPSAAGRLQEMVPTMPRIGIPIVAERVAAASTPAAAVSRRTSSQDALFAEPSLSTPQALMLRRLALYASPVPGGLPFAGSEAVSTATPAPLEAGFVLVGASTRTQRLIDAVARACAPHEPVRLHVEWQGDSARVWLGVDADSAQRLPELAQALSRWLGSMGMRLRSLVCNGHSVLDRGTPSPWVPDRPGAAATPPAGRITFIEIVAEGGS